MTPPKHIAALRAMLRQHGAPGQSDLGSRIGHERRVFGPAFPYLLPGQHGNYLGDELPNSVAERLGSVLDVQGQNMAYSDLPLPRPLRHCCGRRLSRAGEESEDMRIYLLAEREGFEPPIRLPVCRISSAVHSTTLPPLQALNCYINQRSPIMERVGCYPFATQSFLARLFMTSCRSRSTRAAASSCIPGMTCEYKSIVIPTFECPRRSLAILGWTPEDNIWVACACRKSWKRMRGSVLFFASRRRHWCVMVRGCNGLPSA